MSARWVSFLGCIPADHFDEVGQLAKIGPDLLSGFYHIDLYRQLETLLHQEGTKVRLPANLLTSPACPTAPETRIFTVIESPAVAYLKPAVHGPCGISSSIPCCM